MTRPALVLVDLQRDFLGRAGFVPPVPIITARTAELLAECRNLNLPVLHVQTVIRADGTDRMPHWIREGRWECVDGTAGALAPAELAPAPGEIVVRKPFFSGFGNPELGRALAAQRIDTLVVAGIYLHACVRSTVLDAYERGYKVWVADDATGSTEPQHAENSRLWLRARAAEFLPVAEIISRLDGGSKQVVEV